MSSLKLNGKVIVISDATTEFGKVCAKLLASSGARLVLNAPSGFKYDASNAFRETEVLETYEDLQDVDRVVGTAISKYGTIHAIIHNASFRTSNQSGANQSSLAWQSARDDVLNGTFKCLKAAWACFRKQKYGRVVLVQSNHGADSHEENAVRFALFGLVETLSREGARYDIHVNLLTSQAKSFVTGQEAPAESSPVLSLSSMAAVLASSNRSELNGFMFEATSNKIQRLRWERAQGLVLNPDVNYTAGMLLENWPRVNDFSQKSFPDSAMDLASLLPKSQALPPNPKRNDYSYTGKVAIITGGASGLGKCYALAFARLGASVVVNDLADPQAVVDEIHKTGGNSIGCRVSVEEGETIAKAAINAFGRIDILINNAGYLIDKSFANMTFDQWNAMIAVHVNGTYQMTKSVWPYFCKQGYGRIVNTASTSGIYGNFGQANYSAAKLGILGLSEASAREGLKHNIRVNTIAPAASTPMFLKVLAGTGDKNLQANLKPEYVVPTVLLLCSDQETSTNGSTGGLYEVGCGWTAATRLRPAEGCAFDNPSSITPAEILRNWRSLEDLHHTETPSPHTKLKLKGGSETTPYHFDSKDVILYNLSVGASRTQLNLVYESHSSFQPVPTFGYIPLFASATIVTHHKDLVSNFNLNKSLLGEHYFEILHYPLPTQGHLITTRQPVSILSKPNAAIAITGYTTTTSSGTPLFYNETHFFMSEARAPSGSPRSDSRTHPAARSYPTPTTPPDHTTMFRTTSEQAALYRLNGDFTSIHIDPVVAQRAGHKEPVLHGHCTLGVAGRCVFERYGMFKSIKARFIGVVYPGQTLKVEMWRDTEEEHLVVFRVVVVETGRSCVSGGVRILEQGAKQSEGIKASL